MPYKSEKIPIAGTNLDQRRKLSDEQKRAIKILANEDYSQRQLAAMFNVSKGTIQSIVNPTERKAPKQRPTAYWTEAKRKYRKRKESLYKSGDLKVKKVRKRKIDNHEKND